MLWSVLLIVLALGAWREAEGRTPVGFNSEPASPFRDNSDLVPVSSTVIPVTNLPARRGGESRLLYPFSYSAAYARKLRLFEKSSKPSSPVRLITKHSSLKGAGDGHD